MTQIITRNKWKRQFIKVAESDMDSRERLPVVDQAEERRLEVLQSKTLFGPCPSLSSISTTSSERFLQDTSNVKKLTEQTWVQCENPECLKWRQISPEDADDLDADAPWFCFMNADENHNTCDDVEEDYRRTEHLLRKCKLRFIVSPLSEGSLVLARMPGYCRWPAVICPDPFSDRSIYLDYDGEPLSYHVEFLGAEHTHTWLHARHVEPYKKVEDPAELYLSARQSQQLSQSQAGSQGHSQAASQAKRKRKARMGSRSYRDQRTKYKGNCVESATEQAEQWLEMDPETRLANCTFKYHPDNLEYPPQGTSKDNEGLPADKTNMKNVTAKKSEAEHGEGERKRNREYAKEKADQKRLNERPKLVKDSCQESKKRRPAGKQANGGNIGAQTTFNGMRVIGSISAADDTAARKSKRQTGSRLLYRPTAAEPGSPQWVKGIGTLREELSRTATMIGRSKQEKFSIDVEMYRRNKSAFEQDVASFLRRHGCKIRKMPVWKSIPVTLYELFVAVHERGGFHQVTANKQWLPVYRELSQSTEASNGMPAKTFYERYLLPYELYVNGQDYQSTLPVKTPKTKKISPGSAGRQTNMEGSLTEVEIKSESHESETFGTANDGASVLSGASELENIAKEIEKYHRELEKMGSEGDQDFAVNFFDESPNKKNLSKHHFVSDAGGEFREPEISGGELAGAECAGGDSGGRSSESSQDRVLHEMRTLQSELNWLGDDVARCWNAPTN